MYERLSTPLANGAGMGRVGAGAGPPRPPQPGGRGKAGRGGPPAGRVAHRLKT